MPSTSGSFAVNTSSYSNAGSKPPFTQIFEGSGFPGTPDPSPICVNGGFDPAFEYELVFTAKDPLVLGIGFAATRDLNSFLRYADRDDTGVANPVAKPIRRALSRGSSQSGNFIRTFINLGFN